MIHPEDHPEHCELLRKASLDRLTRPCPLTTAVGFNPINVQWVTTPDALLVSLPLTCTALYSGILATRMGLHLYGIPVSFPCLQRERSRCLWMEVGRGKSLEIIWCQERPLRSQCLVLPCTFPASLSETESVLFPFFSVQ